MHNICHSNTEAGEIKYFSIFNVHSKPYSITATSMPVQPSAPPEESHTSTDSVSSDVRSPTLVTPPPTGPPPEYNGLYPTLTDDPPETNNIDIDELRRRRLARLNKPRR